MHDWQRKMVKNTMKLEAKYNGMTDKLLQSWQTQDMRTAVIYRHFWNNSMGQKAKERLPLYKIASRTGVLWDWAR